MKECLHPEIWDCGLYTTRTSNSSNSCSQMLINTDYEQASVVYTDLVSEEWEGW